MEDIGTSTDWMRPALRPQTRLGRLANAFVTVVLLAVWLSPVAAIAALIVIAAVR